MLSELDPRWSPFRDLHSQPCGTVFAVGLPRYYVPGFRSLDHGIRQTLESSFSAVSKPNFASKYAFESSRRDLHNALLCTAPKSHFFQKKLVEFAKICENFQKFCEIRNFSNRLFAKKIEIAAVQKDANLVELEKCCQTHILLQKIVLIQPRTSPPKICKIFEKCIFEKCIFEKCIFEEGPEGDERSKRTFRISQAAHAEEMAISER